MSRASRHRAEKEGRTEDKPPERTKAEVLQGIEQTLQILELGLADFVGDDPTRRMAGLANVCAIGPATTQAIQKLRSVVDRDAFNAWYAPIQEEMKADPLMRFMWDLRINVLKRGGPGRIEKVGHINYGPKNEEALKPILADPPPGARGFFTGDELGGDGWEIEQPDGTITKYYVNLPEDAKEGMGFTLHHPDHPETHKGMPLADTSLQTICRLYVEEVRSIAGRALEEFG